MRFFAIHLSFYLFVASCASGISSRNIISAGSCNENGANVVFANGSRKNFQADKGYKCSDFKLNNEHQYAAWTLTGNIVSEIGGEKKTYADAILYVLNNEKVYAVTENSRYIRNWYFVRGHPEMIVETTFEHGPSNYVLYDLEKKERVEICSQFELIQCPKLQIRLLEKH